MAELPDKIAFEVVTPDRRVLAIDVDEVVVPSVEGYLGVLPGHTPLLARIDVGEISYRVGKERRYMSVTAGFAEVLRDRVSVLAKASELPEEIDLVSARCRVSSWEKHLPYIAATGRDFSRCPGAAWIRGIRREAALRPGQIGASRQV